MLRSPAAYSTLGPIGIALLAVSASVAASPAVLVAVGDVTPTSAVLVTHTMERE